MKTKCVFYIIFISIFFLTIFSSGRPQSLTDEDMWEYFDKITNYWGNTCLFHLTSNMRIEITGEATPEDSAVVNAVVVELDSLIETIKFEIVKENANVEIDFDQSLRNNYPDIKTSIGIWHSTPLLKIYPRVSLAIFSRITTQSERNGLIWDLFAHLLIGRTYNSSPYPKDFSISRNIELDESKKAEIERFILRKLYSKNLGDQLRRYWGLPLSLPWTNSRPYGLAVLFIWVILLFLVWIIFRIFKLNNYINNKIPSRWLRGNILILLSVLLFILINHLYNSDLTQKYFYPVYLKYLVIYSMSFGLLLFNLLYLIDQYILNRIRFNWLAKIVDLILTYFSMILVSLFVTIFFIFPVGSRMMILFPFELALGIFLFRLFRNTKILKIRTILRDKDLELAKTKEALTKAELNALHSRINPHFLYNALNSIAGIAHENADKTEQMALSLARLFRHNTNKQDEVFSTLKQEMEMVRIYLDIEKVRFGDRLNYSIHLPEALKKVQIPRFLIQPLVENAIKHGISKITENGVVKVNVESEDGWLKLSVHDNGPDFPEDLLSGYGIQSVYDKLNLLYPEGHEVRFAGGKEKSINISLKMEK